MTAPERKVVRGVVVSDKMAKTIIVRAERLVLHPRYKKYVKKFTRFYAHDEKEEAKIGDTVSISMTRPLSKLKRWRLQRVLVASRGTLEHDMAGGAEA